MIDYNRWLAHHYYSIPTISPWYFAALITPFNNGNRTEWSPIRSVIIQVIDKIGCPRSGSLIYLIPSMITDRIGWHKVLLPIINHNYNKICDIKGFFKTYITRKSKSFFASSGKSHLGGHMRWHVLSNCLGMTHTVLLHCPISAEIRTVDSQSALRILLWLWSVV